MSIENRPSGLIIAPKRSGTNFTHDILSLVYAGAVNEPLGLHNDTQGGKRNPLDPWNYSGPEHVSYEYGHKELKDDPYGSLLTRQFLGWVNEGGKLVKETDFLYLGWLLASVPLKTVVIQRDPRASIASFKKSGLYEHWGYQQKMNQFAQTVNATPLLHDLYGDFIDTDSFSDLLPHQQLAFYYSVATSEIARTTHDHETLDVDYTSLTNDSVASFQKIVDFLNAPWNEDIVRAIQARTSATRHTGTHGTFRKGSDLVPFTHILSPKEDNDIRAIYADFGINLPKEKIIFPNGSLKQKEKRNKEFSYIENVRRSAVVERVQAEAVLIEEGDQNPLHIAKTLTTNQEYAQFLSWLVQHDIPITVNGKPLFHNERPQGKIRMNNSDILVDEQYTNHPVPFVNWFGAAMYCAWLGGRLPSMKEWQTKILLPNSTQTENYANIGQQYSDTTAVTFFPPDERGIYDTFGNMSIWTHNKVDDPYTKQRAGLGWNHTQERGTSPTPRPYWLGTAGVGIRPVFDSVGSFPADEGYLSNLKEIIKFLTEVHHADEKQASKELAQKITTFF